MNCIVQRFTFFRKVKSIYTVSTKNCNPRQRTIEMPNPNASWPNCVRLIMNKFTTELPNFIRKYYLLHELLIFKYWRQNISVSNIALHTAVKTLGRPAHRARETVHLLTHKTPDFITPALWPANSPDLNPVDCQIWGSCRTVFTAARFVTSTSLSCIRSKSGNISTRWSSIKRSGSGIHVFELAFDFEHTVDI